MKKSFSYIGGKFFNNLLSSEYDFDGKCILEWRQGIKHDCAKIMELTLENGIFRNGNGEAVDLEEQIIFPLVKGSEIKNPIINKFSKYVIVTQKFWGEDTSHLEFDAPKTWKYLKKILRLLQTEKAKFIKILQNFRFLE